jgi:hypothetical protein
LAEAPVQPTEAVPPAPADAPVQTPAKAAPVVAEPPPAEPTKIAPVVAELPAEPAKPAPVVTELPAAEPTKPAPVVVGDAPAPPVPGGIQPAGAPAQGIVDGGGKAGTPAADSTLHFPDLWAPQDAGRSDPVKTLVLVPEQTSPATPATMVLDVAGPSVASPADQTPPVQLPASSPVDGTGAVPPVSPTGKGQGNALDDALAPFAPKVPEKGVAPLAYAPADAGDIGLGLSGPGGSSSPLMNDLPLL